jgi:hypothetical protein
MTLNTPRYQHLRMLNYFSPSSSPSSSFSSFSSSSSSSSSSSFSSSFSSSVPSSSSSFSSCKPHGAGSHRGQCSALQHQWYTSHPIYNAIRSGQTINTFLAGSGIARQYYGMLGDLSALVPASLPSLFYSELRLIDYVQLPCYIWVPEFFYPHLVPLMPCPASKCNGKATRQRWNPNGPRVVHGIHSAAYLLCWQYMCLECGTVFAVWDDDLLSKLPLAVQGCFRFVLTHKAAVTMELHQRIIDARVHGGSLRQLERELNRNRHTRMLELHPFSADVDARGSRGRVTHAYFLCTPLP